MHTTGPELIILLKESKSAAIGIFDLEGNLLEANDLFQKTVFRTSKIGFVNPTIDRLLQTKGEGIIFEGYLTLANTNDKNESFNCSVLKDLEQLIVFFELDSANENQTIHKLSELIQENSNLHRELVKEKILEDRQLKTITALNLEINQLLGMAAHDLRSPIAMAISFTELLRESEKIKEDKKLSLFLDIVTERCNYAMNLLSDLLDISKIEAGKIDLQFEMINYTSLVLRVVELHRTIAAHKGITINLEFTEGAIEVVVDQRKIEQIITNLLSNAIKFSPANSLISVKMKVESETICTEIDDQGPGIPEGIVDNIFKSFGEKPNKPTASEVSTGLGLSIAKKLVEAHGGQIGVKNRVEGGASFFFTIPLKQTNTK